MFEPFSFIAISFFAWLIVKSNSDAQERDSDNTEEEK
jgi:hypothetical protein